MGWCQGQGWPHHAPRLSGLCRTNGRRPAQLSHAFCRVRPGHWQSFSMFSIYPWGVQQLFEHRRLRISSSRKDRPAFHFPSGKSTFYYILHQSLPLLGCSSQTRCTHVWRFEAHWLNLEHVWTRGRHGASLPARMYATMRASLWAPALGLISIAMGTRAGLGGRQVSTFGRTIRAVKSALGPLAGFFAAYIHGL